MLAKITVHETDAPHVPRVVDSCIDNIGVVTDQSASTVRTAELIWRYQVRDDRWSSECVNSARLRIELAHFAAFPTLRTTVFITHSAGEFATSSQ